MAMRCRFICQNMFRTVGDRWEGLYGDRDLNREMLGSR